MAVSLPRDRSHEQRKSPLALLILYVVLAVSLLVSIVCFKYQGNHVLSAYKFLESKFQSHASTRIISGTSIPAHLVQSGRDDPHPDLWTERSPG